jgi:hypothetical protein
MWTLGVGFGATLVGMLIFRYFMWRIEKSWEGKMDENEL